MTVWGWGLIAIGVIAAILFVAGLMYSRPRTEYLRSHFAPDDFRTGAGAGDGRAAESVGGAGATSDKRAPSPELPE
jgi:hypothetical protein